MDKNVTGMLFKTIVAQDAQANINEPRCEKTCFLHMRIQRRRSAAQ